jgi:hypothetical protein
MEKCSSDTNVLVFLRHIMCIIVHTYYTSLDTEHCGRVLGVDKVEVKLRPTVSRSVCLGIGLPSGADDPILVFCLTVADILRWSALSDERMDL